MEHIVAMAVATAVLVAIPGPNVALIIATTLRCGFGRGAVVVLGTTAGVGIQLALVIGGLSAVLALAAHAMSWIKWLGVAYLLWLGIRTWREPAAHLADVEGERGSAARIFWHGCAMALINPKTLLFNAAFLPQFLPPGSGAGALALLGCVYLAIFVAGDMLWSGFAHSARRLLGRTGRLRNRLAGSIYLASGLGLALARVER